MKRAAFDEEERDESVKRPAQNKELHRDPSEWKLPACPVVKAYRNEGFLNSSHARHIRILAEYEETMQRLRANEVQATVMFFGSARSKDHEQHADAVAKANAALSNAKPGSSEAAAAQLSLERLDSSKWMCDYMEKIRRLARRLTEWSLTPAYQPRSLVGVSRTAKINRSNSQPQIRPASPAQASYLPHSSDGPDGHRLPQSVYICTGGGPGFMEAANRGASEVINGRSIGMGISLPFETGLNPYVSPELAFEYHYFFTRKFWMAYYMQALVVAPGGFGTFDELFELLTLKQTGKMNREMSIVLIGKDYWNEIINWKAIARYGVINAKDIEQLFITDDIDEAFTHITNGLLEDAGMPSEGVNVTDTS